MELSKRAYEYLKKQKRDSKWIVSNNELIDYFKSQDIKLSKNFLQFQIKYSGFELRLRESEKDKFRAYLVSKNQILNNEPIESYEHNHQIALYCGDHETAQFEFVLKSTGEICTILNNGDLNTLYSSFEKKIEEYAFKDQYLGWSEHSPYLKVIDQKRLEEFMNNKFKLIEEITDKYSNWWKGENLIIANGKWLDKTEKYLHMYGKNKTEWSNVLEELQVLSIL